MASLNIDANAWPGFILRWTFAGFWGAVGWAIAVRYLFPAVPFL